MKFPNIKVGDKVVIPCHPIHGPGLLCTVSHVTPTQFKVGKNSYRRKDGRKIGQTGDTWSSSTAQVATPKLIGEITKFQECQNVKGKVVQLYDAIHKEESHDVLLAALPHIEAALKTLQPADPSQPST
jgi:hypothetical protein